ncbi:MAG TPA: NAD(P)/FAD-dependent oxidoreductase [Acidimicrobiales bacterium]|nr:NAD(P)/FAD-dependent oxidoreductase [Acidimicrobiales bacterium]
MSSANPASADDVVIVGAGPAGLTAAYQLAKAGKTSTVLEADSVVGGISRSAERDGWRFDIGGHRFFTKVKAVDDLWHEILPDEDFLLRPRMSRIYYKGKYYDYPLKAKNALMNLGPVEATKCVASYAWARVRPPKDQGNLEGWVAARFGYRLYRTFFKTYTEKVWGVPATELPSDWAAQRIKNLSLSKAVVNSLLPKRNQKEITSLIEEFQYPKYGPGMMWERCRDKVEAAGTKVLMNTRAAKIRHADGRALSVVAESEDGTETEYPSSAVISSMPITALLRSMDPLPPAEVLRAADDLHYRDFLTVALVVPESAGFPDNWIYIHAPDVKVGRIQNFGSWSPYLVKDGRTCLGLEYFVFEGDEYWTMSDEALVALGTRELKALGLVDPSQVEAGYVVRMPKAYPHYDADYKANVEILKAWLAEHAANVHPVGRNGMHKYNNQDHSMYTAMLTVENLLGAHHDVWAVNVEEDYHEEGSATAASSSGTGRDAPVLPKRGS